MVSKQQEVCLGTVQQRESSRSLTAYDQISVSLLIKFGVKPTDELIGKLNYFLILADNRFNPEIGDREKYVYWCGERCLSGILKKERVEQSNFIPFSEVKLDKRTRLINFVLDACPDNKPLPEQYLRIKELKCKILTSKSLTDREKECIIGRYLENLKIKDLGDNASYHLKSGLKKIRENYILYV